MQPFRTHKSYTHQYPAISISVNLVFFKLLTTNDITSGITVNERGLVLFWKEKTLGPKIALPHYCSDRRWTIFDLTDALTTVI